MTTQASALYAAPMGTPPPAPRTVLLPTDRACPDGCCMAVQDPTLPRRPDQDIYDRPMYQVLRDDSAWSEVDLGGEFASDGSNSMRVCAVEYARPDRIFL